MRSATIILTGFILILSTPFLDPLKNGATAQAPADSGSPAIPTVKDSMNIEMVSLPAGTFRMGSPPSEKCRSPNENPQHRVTISRPFSMARTETTVRQFRHYVNESGAGRGGLSAERHPLRNGKEWEDHEGHSWMAPGHDQTEENPVTCVSWHDAISYCNWLSERSGFQPCYRLQAAKVVWDRQADGYRLPTEAEWEYACRAGTETCFYNGKARSDLNRAAWYDGNAGGKTWPAGQKEANPWGLYDMIGNVWEWCWDLYGPYPAGPVTDPEGPEAGIYHVLRGGSWYDSYYEFEGVLYLRCAFRLSYVGGADHSDHYIGFRVARTPKASIEVTQ